MAKKKVGELVHADLGKQVVIEEPDGDRTSGELKFVGHYIHGQARVQAGSSMLELDPDLEVEISD